MAWGLAIQNTPPADWKPAKWECDAEGDAPGFLVHAYALCIAVP